MMKYIIMSQGTAITSDTLVDYILDYRIPICVYTTIKSKIL